MKGINKKTLDYAKTIQYFLDHIEGGGCLSNILLSYIDFSRGVFTILLPQDAKPDKVYNLSTGGINPITAEKKHTSAESGREFLVKYRKETSYEVSLFIEEFLKQESNNRALCEDVVRAPSTAKKEKSEIGVHCFSNNVYFSLNCSNHIEDIQRVLRKTDHTWHSLCILYSGKSLPSKIRKEELIEACNNVAYVITSAHDSENFIIWENTNAS